MGALVVESQALNATIDVPLTLRRIHRLPAWSATGEQPSQWTLIDFTCPDDVGDELARQFAAALFPGRWYVDYATDSTSWVVFAGRVFTDPRGDDTGRQEAITYARDVGVPEAQLDWPH
ncbi:hypothetical protein KIF24_24050 [Micromonospora sp. Llam7]|uniref:hypothetical protein n=1 Tax=Micromonospora tarapacensis TaxID=2835305 RepID=UPI001C8285FE|nr:hypothetical protein [Micromonospora tarapacensis]MBX7268786.1 hypothetical protein [Micromonospora tarapacensis]